MFPATIVVGLAVGYVPFISEGFSLSRIIVFFPFFYAGYMLDPIGKPKPSKARSITACLSTA